MYLHVFQSKNTEKNNGKPGKIIHNHMSKLCLQSNYGFKMALKALQDPLLTHVKDLSLSCLSVRLFNF